MTPEERVERFARVKPPAGHAGRVRARSGPGATVEARPVSTTTVLPWRWALPAAACAMVVLAAIWQSDRASRQVWFAAPPAAPQWSGKGVETPVLPPRAYWAMSAFDEFRALRGGSASAEAPARTPSAAAERSDADVQATVAVNADAERPWSPLPPIELEDITPAPLEVPAITGLEPLTVESIEIAPIDIVSLDKEQK